MSNEVVSPRKKLPLLKLAVVAAAAIAGAVLVLRGLDVGEAIEQGMALIRRAGPVAFFLGMALLPAVGAPLTLFTIPAGEAFAPQMTLGGVIAVTLVAVALNLALTYWLAHRGFRPLLERWVTRYGYRVPRVSADNALTVALLVRLTPGPPFFLQSYILGLAAVPFRLYMIVSWLAVLPWAVGAVVLGRGILNGNFKVAAIGLGVIVVAIVVVQAVRRKLAKRES
jgi:uncharacterized membrane protein YdjX (TVP38/TMEM64 family)